MEARHGRAKRCDQREAGLAEDVDSLGREEGEGVDAEDVDEAEVKGGGHDVQHLDVVGDDDVCHVQAGQRKVPKKRTHP